jgi:hypothetical protein
LKGQPPGVTSPKDKGAVREVDGVTTPAMPMSLGGKGSHHMRGLAIDAGKQAADVNSKVKLADFGLFWGGNWQGKSNDPVHIQSAADGGVFDGPKSGYAATLHGNEAVIPLKDGAVPVSMSQEFNMTATNLGELVAIMKNNVGMQDYMLAVLDDIRQSQSTTTDNTGKMVAMAA